MQILICPPRGIAERNVNLFTRNDNGKVLSTEREGDYDIIHRIARFSRLVPNANTINMCTQGRYPFVKLKDYALRFNDCILNFA